MRKIILSSIYIIVFAITKAGYSQSPAIQAPSPAIGLFETDSILDITLSGSIKEILHDRGDDPQFHPLTVTYNGGEGLPIVLQAEGRARGHFRKLPENCFFPPILIHFTKDELIKSSVFKEQDKLKLVMPCRGEEYVVREWLVYKLYNLVTPKSFRVRLVRVRFNSVRNNKPDPPFYGVLMEEERQMARRNDLIAVRRKLGPTDLEPEAFLTMAVFEYLVGNTDWSVQYLQNIKLLSSDSLAIATPVPHDFDLTGIVNAPYAKPAEELLMNSVRERRYRGYCVKDMKKFETTVALFNRLKQDIYALYNDCTLVDDKYKKATSKYLDEFYAIINNPDKLKKEFSYPCDVNGTGNVIVKGLRALHPADKEW